MKELAEIIRIEHGAHKTFQDGNCAMELVAFMAGEVHLAIKLLDDAIPDPATQSTEGRMIYLQLRLEAVRDVLKPVMGILAPYMPNYKDPKEEFAEQDAAWVAAPTVIDGKEMPWREGDVAMLNPERNVQDSNHETEIEGGQDQRLCEGCGRPDVPGDSLNRFCHDCWEAGDQDGYLDGEDEKSYSARHA